MDDALAHKDKYLRALANRAVLILVVMDDALAPPKIRPLLWFVEVLILVVMDDALAHNNLRYNKRVLLCLNPCCNG